MNFNLTWDLFVIVFFTVIIAYSFIIGRNSTLKVVVSTYIAILAADGVGNLVERFLIGEDPFIRAFEVTGHQEKAIIVKILIFVLTLVLIVIKGSFSINIGKTDSPTMNLMLNFAYGILSAGLITSTILIYISGNSLFQDSAGSMTGAMKEIYDHSYMVRAILDHGNWWFAAPAWVFLVASIMGTDE